MGESGAQQHRRGVMMRGAVHHVHAILHHHHRAANVAFHETILAAARNRQLADTLRLVLNRPGASLRRIMGFTPQDIRRRIDDHRRILDAILTQDPGRAELLMREHVSGIRNSAGKGRALCRGGSRCYRMGR